MIKENILKLFKELPPGTKLIAATKQRSPQEIIQGIEAGVEIIGENYVQEAQSKFEIIGRRVSWHLIGHLQKNKVKKAVEIFDMIQTLDSEELAQSLDRECKKINKVMPVLIEVNIAKEPQKKGINPADLEGLVKKILRFKNIKLSGLMTMGPFLDNPQDLRPYFRQAKDIFERIKSLSLSELDWKYLSMGMSDSYKIAVQEGANMVRVGSVIFGPRLNKTR